VVGHRVGQFRVRQRSGAHDVAEVQFVADGDRGQGHALGAVLAAVPGRQRVSHGQDQTFRRLRVRVGQSERHVRTLGNGQLPEHIDVVPASALQQDVVLHQFRNGRVSVETDRH